MKKFSLFLLYLFTCHISVFAQVFNMPVFDKTDIPNLHIDKIEITKDTTYLYCKYIAEESSWANISRDTYIEDVISKRKYPILKVDGFPFAPEKKHFADPTEQKVVFYFPSIHPTTKFDFIEDRTEKVFNIFGVELDKSYDESYSMYQLNRYQNMFDFYMSARDTLRALEYKECEYRAIEYIYGVKSIPLCNKIIESSGLFIGVQNYEKALYYRKKEFDIVKTLYSESDSSYVFSLQYLAYCHSLVGNYSESDSLFKQVAHIYSQAFDKSDDYIWVLDRQVSNYLAEDSLENAIGVLEEKIGILKTHKDTVALLDANALYMLADLYVQRGWNDKAVNTCKEIANILRCQSGDIEDYSLFLYSTAKSFANVDSFTIAATIMQEVVDVRKNYLKEDDARYIESLNHLAEYYSRLHCYREAVQIGVETIRCLKLMESRDKRSLMIGLNNLAQYYADVDSFDLARSRMQEAVILQNELGVSDSMRLKTLCLLAEYCEKSRDHQMALVEGKNVVNQVLNVAGKSESYYNCLNHIACIYEKMDSVDSAIALIEDIIQNLSDNDEKIEQMVLLKTRLAHCYSKKGHYGKAISIQEDVTTLLKSDKKNREYYAVGLSALSEYYIQANQPEKALEYAIESVDVFKDFKDSKLYDYARVILRRLANGYFAKGNYKEALEIHKESAKVLNELVGKDDIEYAETIHLIAFDYAELDSLDKAIDILSAITKRWKESHGVESDRYLVWLSNLAYFSLESHRYIEALQIGKYVEERIRELGQNREEYSKILDNLARYYAGLFDYAKAIELESKALEIQLAISGELSEEYRKRLNNLGALYACIGNDSAAISNLEKSLETELILKGELTKSYVGTLNNLAYVYGLSDKMKAIKTLNRGVQICDSLGDHSLLYAQLLENRASYYSNMCYYEEAIRDREMANGVLLNNLDSHNIKYVLGLCHLATIYKDAKDFLKSASVINKSLGLLKDIYTDYHNRYSSTYTSMYWNLLNDTFLSVYPGIVALCPNDSTISNLYDAILFSKNILLKKELDNVKWSDIKKSLNDDEIAIEIVCPRTQSYYDGIHGVDTYYALVVKNGYSAPKMIKLFDSFETYNPIIYGEMTWMPLLKELDGIRNIYFSTTGYLSKIAIENLSVGRYECISDSFNIYRLSSTRELLSRKQSATMNVAVLYGGLNYDNESEKSTPWLVDDKTRAGFEPLYFSRGEVQTIASVLKNSKVNYQLFFGDDGTEESFMNLSGKDINVIHLATHGRYFDRNEAEKEMSKNNMRFIQTEKNPYLVYEDIALTRSFLVMSGGNKIIARDTSSVTEENDGYLTALEISKMDLSSVDLVTLSACESGLGDFGPDSGILGLQRGFKKAGAKSILMTTEKVDDEATSILMTTFYKNLMNGQSKMHALKNAQKYLRQVENGKYYDPKYWTPFILLDGLN